MKTYSVNFQFTIHIPLKENEPAKVGFQRRNRVIAKIAKILEEEGIGSEISYRKAILREEKNEEKI